MLPVVTRTSMAAVAAFFGAAFAISGIVRGDVAPALAGGVLGAAVVYLVLNRVQEHNDAVRRRREQQER
jgi:presenilin-like A22 family membrane protease